MTISQQVSDLAGNTMANEYPLTFITEQKPEIVLPKIVGTTPADRQTGVPVTSVISANFNKQMDPSTISIKTFTITRGSSTTGIDGTVSLSPDGMVGTYRPRSNLDEYTFYTARISYKVKDLAGNTMDGDYPWTFTTEQIAPGL